MAVGPDYQAAHRGAAVVVRGDRRFLRISGKAPGEMLNGILTNRIPGEVKRLEVPPLQAGEAVYAAVLTPRGKMVTDLRILRDRDGSFLLELPREGLQGAMDHLRKYLPPRLASVEDCPAAISLLTVLGPDGSRVLSGEMLEGLPSPQFLSEMKEGDALFVRLRGGEEGVVIGSGGLRTPALDLIVPTLCREELHARLLAAGVRPASPQTWAALQVEGGRPAFGVDMDQETIPVEAGIQARAIDCHKGCYTGQEVIIRLRDRGRVNKRLVGLLLGDAALPSPRTELFRSGREKPVGWITRAVFSPAFGEGAALAYLRREVLPGEEVQVGGEGGPPARVQALGDEGWILG